MWHELLVNKYLRNKTLSQVKIKPTDSPFWKGLMGLKEIFIKNGSFTIGNGQKTRFWEDTWLGDTPLVLQYPSLYNNVRQKNVLSNNPLNIEFRRTLNGNRWVVWLQLVQRLMGVTLTEEPNAFVWKLTTLGIFWLSLCMHT
jgi:hypothetical protein